MMQAFLLRPFKIMLISFILTRMHGTLLVLIMIKKNPTKFLAKPIPLVICNSNKKPKPYGGYHSWSQRKKTQIGNKESAREATQDEG